MDESCNGPWGPLGSLHCRLAKLETVGGGRGLIAATALPAGTLVLEEVPLVSVPREVKEGEDLHAALVRRILTELPPEKRRQVLQAAAALHPVSLSDLSSDVLQQQRKRHQGSASHLASLGEHGLGEDEVLQLLLAMQCNAFYSGLYCNLALINHACKPNCTKLTPWKDVGRPEQGGAKGRVSEVWAIRDIEAGEELTISYLQPLEQSEAARRAQFLEQHLCALPRSPYPAELEAVVEGRGAQELGRIEGELDALEQEGVSASEERLDRLRALLKATQSVCLSPRHLVLARVHAALMSNGVALLEAQDEPTAELAISVIQWALELLATQEVAVGAVHIDVGATCDALSSAMEFLLAVAPKRLFATFPQWGDFSKASKAQYAFRKRSQSIGKLYTRRLG